MLADTLFRVPRTPGLHLLQRRGERGAHELTSWRLRLEPGTSHRYSVSGEETVVVLQNGRGTFRAGGREWKVKRRDVFSEKATALYLPPGAALDVTADGDQPLEAILVSTPAEGAGEPAIVTADDVQPMDRGKG